MMMTEIHPFNYNEDESSVLWTKWHLCRKENERGPLEAKDWPILSYSSEISSHAFMGFGTGLWCISALECSLLPTGLSLEHTMQTDTVSVAFWFCRSWFESDVKYIETHSLLIIRSNIQHYSDYQIWKKNIYCIGCDGAVSLSVVVCN